MDLPRSRLPRCVIVSVVVTVGNVIINYVLGLLSVCCCSCCLCAITRVAPNLATVLTEFVWCM